MKCLRLWKHWHKWTPKLTSKKLKRLRTYSVSKLEWRNFWRLRIFSRTGMFVLFSVTACLQFLSLYSQKPLAAIFSCLPVEPKDVIKWCTASITVHALCSWESDTVNWLRRYSGLCFVHRQVGKSGFRSCQTKWREVGVIDDQDRLSTMVAFLIYGCFFGLWLSFWFMVKFFDQVFSRGYVKKFLGKFWQGFGKMLTITVWDKG